MYTFDSFHISFNPWTVALWTLKHMWIAHVKISWLLVNDCFLFTCFRELLVIGDTDLAALSYKDSLIFRCLSCSFSLVAQSCLTLQPHEPQHARPPCPSPTPRVYSNTCPLRGWCHPTISSSVVPCSSCLQSFSTSGSFQTSQLFTSGGQSIGISASASVLPMSTQDWFPLGWTGWISL